MARGKDKRVIPIGVDFDQRVGKGERGDSPGYHLLNFVRITGNGPCYHRLAFAGPLHSETKVIVRSRRRYRNIWLS
jgi:hypothetical protein